MAAAVSVGPDLDAYRRYFAEEIAAVARLRSPALVEALAAVPREHFLGPGPWRTAAATGAFGASPGPVVTPDADPRRVYHNVAIAIDPARQLFNGEPSTLAACIDRLRLDRGQRIVHLGCGTGYYSALMAHIVGERGHVTAIDVDESLAVRARANLEAFPWVDVRHGDGTRDLPSDVGAILVNAGVTHPLSAWLDALAPGGRLLLPITSAMPMMGPTIGKGLIFLLTKREEDFEVEYVSVVAIYSALGIRDDSLNGAIDTAMRHMDWPTVKRLRRDPHEPDTSCWYHGHGFCFARGMSQSASTSPPYARQQSS